MHDARKYREDDALPLLSTIINLYSYFTLLGHQLHRITLQKQQVTEQLFSTVFIWVSKLPNLQH